MKRMCFLFSATLLVAQLSAQLHIDNATFYIQSGGTVTVQGNVTSNVDIQGPGKLLLKGSANQDVNMNGFTIPNLEMDNTANATLTGNARIGTSMLFTNGKIIQGNFNCRLADIATVTGAGASKFFETTGTGQLLKEVNSNLSNYNLPVGVGSSYHPVSITTSGTYSSATVGVQGKAGSDPNKHPRSTDYLNLYWPITRTGVTGTVNATGTYDANFTGVEADMRGIFWNGASWSLVGASIDNTLNTASAPIAVNGDLYAMNRFVLTNVKAFLQGPYNSGTGFMNDLLRNSTGSYTAGTFPASNLLPVSDPYRTATYSTNFPHVANSSVETISLSVLNDQPIATKNVVDWVFLELRNTVGGATTVLQTRSALLLRDGSIVDIDGVSPVYFKNVDANSYNISVRHRNHLGQRSGAGQSLSLTTGAATDFTNNANILSGFGAQVAAGVYGLYAGNVNLNGNVRISGASATISDFEQLKTIIGSLPLINNTYSAGDVNMNRTARITGASATISDFEFIKAVLGSSPTITQPVH